MPRAAGLLRCCSCLVAIARRGCAEVRWCLAPTQIFAGASMLLPARNLPTGRRGVDTHEQRKDAKHSHERDWFSSSCTRTRECAWRVPCDLCSR